MLEIQQYFLMSKASKQAFLQGRYANDWYEECLASAASGRTTGQAFTPAQSAAGRALWVLGRMWRG